VKSDVAVKKTKRVSWRWDGRTVLTGAASGIERNDRINERVRVLRGRAWFVWIKKVSKVRVVWCGSVGRA
jgi:hypothetical protein